MSMNVVLCTCDQLRAFEVGCYGHPVVSTPAMDSLAAAGTRFECAVSNNPVCVPARSALITGQYSRTCAGRLDNAYADDGPVAERTRLRDATIAEHFQQAGYRTALIGKWHMHPHPTVAGFEEAVFPRVQHRYRGQTYFRGDGTEAVVDEFAGDYEHERLREFLDDKDDRPFFLYYNISLPHQPVWEGVPERYHAMYDRANTILRDNVYIDGRLSHDEHWFRIYLYSDYFWEWLADKRSGANSFDPSRYPLPREDFDLRDLTALYYGGVTATDDQLGELLRVLDERNLRENTIVVFLSDHGDNLGSHDSYNKGRLIEESIRIPLIISDPRFSAIANHSQVAQTIDVYPTLAALAGLEPPDSAQGRDLSSIVSGREATVEPNLAFIETGAGEIGVRTPRRIVGARLAKDYTTVDEPLSIAYDLEEDPYELRWLAADEEAKTLSARLLRWHRETPWLNASPG